MRACACAVRALCCVVLRGYALFKKRHKRFYSHRTCDVLYSQSQSGTSFLELTKTGDGSQSTRARQALDWVPLLVSFMQSNGSTTCHPTAKECLDFLDRLLTTQAATTAGQPPSYVPSLSRALFGIRQPANDTHLDSISLDLCAALPIRWPWKTSKPPIRSGKSKRASVSAVMRVLCDD